jgi:hypothetical protein
MPTTADGGVTGTATAFKPVVFFSGAPRRCRAVCSDTAAIGRSLLLAYEILAVVGAGARKPKAEGALVLSTPIIPGVSTLRRV